MAIEKSLRQWVKWERYYNDFYVRPTAFKFLPKKKSLKILTEITSLHLARLKRRNCDIVEANPPKNIKELFLNSRNEVSILIHPFAKKELQDLEIIGKPQKAKVVITSSFRSFFYKNCIVKVSLPQSKDVPDFDKYLFKQQIERSVVMSKLLDHEINKKTAAKFGFKYLKECLGISIKSDTHPWGMLVREIPREVLTGKKTLIGVISYVHRYNSKPSMLDKHLRIWKNNLEENILNNLIVPLVNSITFLYREHGLIIEAHQQNILYELTPDQDFTGQIYFRDLEGCRPDMRRRKHLGLSSEILEEVQDYESIFEINKVKEFQKKFKPQMEQNLKWNGAIEFAYRKFIEHSVLHILQKAINESPVLKGQKKPDIVKLSESYLNYVLNTYHPELFK